MIQDCFNPHPYDQIIQRIFDLFDLDYDQNQSLSSIDQHGLDLNTLLYIMRLHQFDIKNKKILILVDDQSPKINFENQINAVSYLHLNEVTQSSLDAQIIINMTSIGHHPHIEQMPIFIESFPHCEVFIETIFDPILTLLGLRAQEQGILTILGIEILVTKIKFIIELNRNILILDQKVKDVISQILLETCNIVLIGMPSAGKTTLGQILSTKMNKHFIDLDDVVVEKTKMPIPDIFKIYGEDTFRSIESDIAYELSCMQQMIIGTGGGTIKRKINMDYLCLNGIVFFIDRDLDKLISSDPNRPLSSSRNALETLHKERYPLYQKYANVIVNNNFEIQATVDAILDEFYQIMNQLL